MSICLVRCPAPFLIDDKVFPPLGLLAVGTALKLQGFPVVVHDGPSDQIPMGHPRYGFGPTSPEYPFAVQALTRIKADNPKARVVIGGPFASLTPGICLQDGFDAVVVGDGEYASQEAFFTDTKMVVATEHPLDWYPIPDRDRKSVV